MREGGLVFTIQEAGRKYMERLGDDHQEKLNLRQQQVPDSTINFVFCFLPIMIT